MRSIIPLRNTIVRSLGATALLGVALLGGCQDQTGNGFVGAAAVLKITGGSDIDAPVATDAGPYSVQVTDTAGTGVSGVMVTFTVSGFASLITDSVRTDEGGNAFTSVLFTQTVGNVTITATAAGIATPVVFHTHSDPGPATQLLIVGGDAQSAARGTQLELPLGVSVADQYGNGVPSVLVTFESAAGTLGSGSVRTDAGGVASSTFTLPATPGQIGILASATVSASVTKTVTFTETGN